MKSPLLPDKPLSVLIVGTKGSGKSYATKRLASYGFAVRAISDEVIASLAAQGNTNPSAADKMIEGNRGRSNGDMAYWVKRTFQTLWDKGAKHVIVEGARHPLEVRVMQELLPNSSFFLLGIDAPIMKRFERFRLRKREGDPLTFEEFILHDDRDRGKGDPGEPWYGQQVDRTLALVEQEWCYYNNGTLEEYDRWVDGIAEKICR